MLSTLEPESAYSAFNLNLASELAPLLLGGGRARRQVAHGGYGGPEVEISLDPRRQSRPGFQKFST